MRSAPLAIAGEEEGVQLNEGPRPPKTLAPAGSTSHWHVYGEVPPAKRPADRTELWPESMVVGLAVTVGAVSAELLTMKLDVPDETVTGEAEESFTLMQ